MSEGNQSSWKIKKGFSSQSPNSKPALFHSMMSSPLTKVPEGAEGATPSAPTTAAETTAAAQQQQQQQRAEEITPVAGSPLTPSSGSPSVPNYGSPSATDSDSWKEAPTPPRATKQKGSFGSGQSTEPFVGDFPEPLKVSTPSLERQVVEYLLCLPWLIKKQKIEDGKVSRTLWL